MQKKPMKVNEDWKVTLSNKNKHGVFTIKSKHAKTSLDAWRVGLKRMVNRHGTKALLDGLFAPKSIEKVSEEVDTRSLAHVIHDVLGEASIGRKGNQKSSYLRNKHSSGAKRHRVSKSLQQLPKQRKERNKKPKAKYLEEVAAADTRTEIPVTKYNPSKKKFMIIRMNQRRRLIDLDGNNKIPKKFGGYRPYVNPYTGLPFGN